MCNRQLSILVTTAFVLLASGVYADGTRSSRVSDGQSCEEQMPFKQFEPARLLFEIAPPPPGWDPVTGIFTFYCFGAPLDDGELVNRAKGKIANPTLFSLTSDDYLALPPGKFKARRDRIRAWAIYDIFNTNRHNLNVELLQNFFSGEDSLGGFAAVVGRGGKKVDQFHAECGASYTQPCEPGPHTACINRDGVPGRYRLHFSPDLNNGAFRLEGSFQGGDVTFTDSGARWAFEVNPTEDHFMHASPANAAAVDLWMESPDSMARLFEESTRLVDGILGEDVPGIFRPSTGDDPGADFVSPREYRFTVGFRF